MKKLLFILALCALCVSVNADSYHDAMIKYMQVDNCMDREQYEKRIKPMIARLYPESDTVMATIMEEYIASQMMDDMVNLFEPAFRNHVTEEDLHELIVICSDPRYKEIEKRSSNITENIYTAEEYIEFAKRLQVVMAAIANDQKVPNDKIKTDVPKKYAKTFMQYYKESKLEETMTAAFQSVGNVLAEALRKEGKSDVEKKVETAMNYANTNLPMIMMSLYYKSEITKEDLQYLTAVSSKPSSVHAMEAVQELFADPIQMSAGLLGKLANWMDAHHPDYATNLHNAVNELEKLQQ
ncbi:MAG: hypothetical protein K6A36_04265 [Paludibacteraceae bacterium]|nr:hypothetical protein [Paludibacteraceae bacterium]